MNLPVTYASKLLAIVLIFSAIASVCLPAELVAQTTPPLRPKNIVFIMLDDADYFDFGFTQTAGMLRDAHTPHIDALRSTGKLYTQFRTASAVCSPTRMSVLTGCNPIRFGGIDALAGLSTESGLPNTIPQLGTVMKLAGKKTGFFGKWHVGSSRPEFQPQAMGFDRHCRFSHKLAGSPGNWSGRYRFVSDSSTEVHDVDFVDRYFADKALGFIDECHQKNEEFFLAYFPLAPHFPWAPPRDYTNPLGFDLTQDRGRMLSMMHAIDLEIERLVTKLRDRDLLDDTMIVLTSDNGAPRRVQHPARVFRGSKGTLLDAGIHVPLIVSWPGHIRGNSVAASFQYSTDLLPTFAELVGLDPTALSPQDGRSFVRTLNQNTRQGHAPVYWELSGGPKRVSPARWGRTQAYQKGNFKLVRQEGFTFWDPGGMGLFNLRRDPGERNDLSNDPQYASLRSSMFRELLQTRKDVSTYPGFPEFASSPERIPYDPRLDVAERDMTLQFDLLAPERFRRGDKNIYSQPGAYRVFVNNLRELVWEIEGYDATGNDASIALTSQQRLNRLNVYRVVLSIGGYKADHSKIEMFIDGVKQDDADNHLPSIFKLRSSVAPSVLGDEGVIIDRAKYSTLRLWRSEWD